MFFYEVDGEIYFIDTGLMTSVIYYNVDIWKEVGFIECDLLWIWEELCEIVKWFMVCDVFGKIMCVGFNFNGIGMLFFIVMNF